MIRDRIFALADEKYRAFHSSLCPGVDNIIGVRAPVLRTLAKELYAEKGIAVLDEIDEDYYEEVLLKGMIIGQNKAFCPDLIRNFIPKITNWAVCDAFCAGLKITKKHKEEMMAIIKEALCSEKEFTVRFGVVMLLDYYVEAPYLSYLFSVFDENKRTEYYVEMAVAWAVSICLMKYFDETIAYLKDCKLDDFTFNKALQKGIESYRITPEQKALLRQMKRK